MYICLCRAVTDEEIRDAVKSGARCVDALKNELGVSTQCGKCQEDVQQVLQQALVDETSPLATSIHLPVVLKVT